jgi:hypothetical protein
MVRVAAAVSQQNGGVDGERSVGEMGLRQFEKCLFALTFHHRIDVRIAPEDFLRHGPHQTRSTQPPQPRCSRSNDILVARVLSKVCVCHGRHLPY